MSKKIEAQLKWYLINQRWLDEHRFDADMNTHEYDSRMMTYIRLRENLLEYIKTLDSRIQRVIDYVSNNPITCSAEEILEMLGEEKRSMPLKFEKIVKGIDYIVEPGLPPTQIVVADSNNFNLSRIFQIDPNSLEVPIPNGSIATYFDFELGPENSSDNLQNTDEKV